MSEWNLEPKIPRSFAIKDFNEVPESNKWEVIINKSTKWCSQTITNWPDSQWPVGPIKHCHDTRHLLHEGETIWLLEASFGLVVIRVSIRWWITTITIIATWLRCFTVPAPLSLSNVGVETRCLSGFLLFCYAQAFNLIFTSSHGFEAAALGEESTIFPAIIVGSDTTCTSTKVSDRILAFRHRSIGRYHQCCDYEW